MNKIYILVAVLLLQGCHSSFLDVKPSKQTIVPVTLEDYALLLNDENVFGLGGISTLNFIGSDEYYLQDAHYNSLPVQDPVLFQKNAYTWEEEIYTGQELRTDWSDAYKRILICNVVLDGLKTIAAVENVRLNEVKGSALFLRAYAYYALTQQYCDVYDISTAKDKLGVPLRKTADPTLDIQRSSLAETYNFITSDLLVALDLLPAKRVQVNMIEPTQQAVHALLSRIYMQQGDYASAATHAGASLKIDNTLLDYNSLDRTAQLPFPPLGVGHPEIIYLNSVPPMTIYSQALNNIDQKYYGLYNANDLRKEVFFAMQGGVLVFKGTYVGRLNFLFSGFARDELYLNLAESLARLGQVEESLYYLNTLREHRFAAADFVTYNTTDKSELLNFILEERKRELFFRGIRWEDMRRLNKEARFQHSLQRVIAGKIYSLEPGSPRFTWPIPPDAIQNGGYVQNKR